jgi:hypothetical protein
MLQNDSKESLLIEAPKIGANWFGPRTLGDLLQSSALMNWDRGTIYSSCVSNTKELYIAKARVPMVARQRLTDVNCRSVRQ